MKPPREGSRKAEVFVVFQQHGIDAAIKAAVNKGLAAGTAKSWCGAWSKAGATPAPAKPEAPGRVRINADAKAIGARQTVLAQGGKVFETGVGKRRPGLISVLGGQVSEVTWSNGQKQFVNNKFLNPM